MQSQKKYNLHLALGTGYKGSPITTEQMGKIVLHSWTWETLGQRGLMQNAKLTRNGYVKQYLTSCGVRVGPYLGWILISSKKFHT